MTGHFEDEILARADAHHEQTGVWPRRISGPVPGLPSVTWLALDYWLKDGKHGLPGGSTLDDLLAAQRGVANPARSRPLSISYILGPADNHRELTGK